MKPRRPEAAGASHGGRAVLGEGGPGGGGGLLLRPNVT